MTAKNWKEEVENIAGTRSDWYRFIPRDAETCMNCRFQSWNVAHGLGIRCIVDQGGRPGSQIKGLMERCDSFEFKASLKSIKTSK
jgi:hypothetical protein